MPVPVEKETKSGTKVFHTNNFFSNATGVTPPTVSSRSKMQRDKENKQTR